jgi:hypothetical protein
MHLQSFHSLILNYRAGFVSTKCHEPDDSEYKSGAKKQLDRQLAKAQLVTKPKKGGAEKKNKVCVLLITLITLAVTTEKL